MPVNFCTAGGISAGQAHSVPCGEYGSTGIGTFGCRFYTRWLLLFEAATSILFPSKYYKGTYTETFGINPSWHASCATWSEVLK